MSGHRWWLGCSYAWWITLGCSADDTTRAIAMRDSAGVASGDDWTAWPERELSIDEVRGLLWPAEPAPRYEARSPRQRQATAALFESLGAAAVGAGPTHALLDLSEAAGFDLQRFTLGEHSYVAVLEPESLRGSGGAFVVRLGPTGGHEVLLQSPHAFHDLGTGELGLQTFFTAGSAARGFFTNTLHRYVQASGEKRKRKRNPADVCHNPEHPFSAATQGLANALPGLEVVQIHGFSDDHEIVDQPGAWAVVSAGLSEGSTPGSTAIANGLGWRFAVPVARFPEDALELGATTNVQRRDVSDVDGSEFVHLELSSDFRRRLGNDPQWLDDFVAALVPPPEADR